MKTIPIWAATWELDCCHPDAEVGKYWEGPVTLRAETDPWWVTDHGAKATEEQRAMGLITVEPTAIEQRSHGCVVQWHDLTFRMEASPPSGPITGRLRLDAHDDFDADEVTVHGTVERIQLVPIRYREKTERYFIPAEQLNAIPATTTLERDGVSTRDDDPNGSITPELLIWLKLD